MTDNIDNINITIKKKNKTEKTDSKRADILKKKTERFIK